MCVTWPATKNARPGFIDLFDDVGSQEEGRVVDIRKISQKKRRRSKMRVDIVELGCIQFAGGYIYCSPNSLICTHTHTPYTQLGVVSGKHPDNSVSLFWCRSNIVRPLSILTVDTHIPLFFCFSPFL